MLTTLHQIATLIDDTALAKLQEMLRLIHSDFLFKLITRHSSIYRLTFDRKISLVITRTYPHRSSISRNIALLNMAIRKGGAFICVALLYEEFSFNF